MSFDVSIMDSEGQDDRAAVRPISLGLAGLSSGIGALGDVVITVDGIPDAARLSAGQFLGDGTWSVRVADLDRLAFYPSPGRHRNCQISIRLRKVDKDMGESYGIGAVYVDIDADGERSTIAGTEGAISLRKRDEDPPPPASQGLPAENPVPEPAAQQSFPPETEPERFASIDDVGPEDAPAQASLDDPFGDDAEMARIFGDPAPAPSEPIPAAAAPKVAEPKPIQRVVRVTRAAPPSRKPASAPEPFPAELPVPPEAPLPGDIPADHGAPLWPAVDPRTESAYQDSSTPDLSEIGIAPPEVVGEPTRSPFSEAPFEPPLPTARQSSPAHHPTQKRPQVGNGGPTVVPVQITPGLRLGKFGKMGRPEDVVSVRIPNGGGGPARSKGSRSIVFVNP